MRREHIMGRVTVMNNKIRRKNFSLSLLLFEFRNVTGNPYIHIFGIGMPVLLIIVYARMLASQISDAEIRSTTVTGLFLGIGAIIPLAVILIGYAATYSQELEKGIPQRLALFGIGEGMTVINKILSEMIFQILSFVIYFAVGIFVLHIKAPSAFGLFCYILCIMVLAVISFAIAHAIALIFKKFGIVYCITMMLYFGIMIVSGLMGVSYEMLPPAVRAVSRMLPTTYIAKDFGDIWLGKSYSFAPMLQAYLFTGAAAGILLFLSLRRGDGRRVNRINTKVLQ